MIILIVINRFNLIIFFELIKLNLQYFKNYIIYFYLF